MLLVFQKDGSLVEGGEGFVEAGAGCGVEVGAEEDCVGVDVANDCGEVAAEASADEEVSYKMLCREGRLV